MPNAPRDTGLQVIHYVAATLTAQTPFVSASVLLGELPLGAVITDADVSVTGAFGPGALLQLSTSPGGPTIVAWNVATAAKLKLANASNALSAAESVVGGPIYARLTALAPAGTLRLVLSYAPKVG